MKFTNEDIKRLKKALRQAEIFEVKSQLATKELASIITGITGITGSVDYLSGDGHGFTPASNDDTHIPIDHLIKAAKDGIDITEEYILDNLCI